MKPMPPCVQRVVFAGLVLCGVAATFGRANAGRPTATPRTEGQTELAFVGRGWTSAGLGRTFGGATGGALRRFEWFPRGNGLRFSSSVVGASARPGVLDGTWRIDRGSASVTSASAEVTWLHAFAGDPPHGRAFAYTGLGLGTYGCLQDMRLRAIRESDYVDATVSGERLSLGAHALVGGMWRLPWRVHVVSELGYVQAFRLGGGEDISLSNPAEAATWSLMKHVVRFPGFGVSGPVFSLGLALRGR